MTLRATLKLFPRLRAYFRRIFASISNGLIRFLNQLKNDQEALMYSGYHTYAIPLAGYSLVTLPAFEIATSDYPTVDKIDIASSAERRIEIKVHFKDVSSLEDADSIGRLLASQVADRLAFEYMIAANDPIKGDSSFERKDAAGVVHAVISQSLGLSMAGHVTKSVAPSDVPRLKPMLESVTPPRRETYFAQFRWIMCQDDPVARFMHLYKILLSLEGGPNNTQRQVDAFITGEDSTVLTIFNPNPKVNRYETIYTRLRNEVGHEIAGTTPASTRQGMEKYVMPLAEHVKAAIAKVV